MTDKRPADRGGHRFQPGNPYRFKKGNTLGSRSRTISRGTQGEATYIVSTELIKAAGRKILRSNSDGNYHRINLDPNGLHTSVDAHKKVQGLAEYCETLMDRLGGTMKFIVKWAEGNSNSFVPFYFAVKAKHEREVTSTPEGVEWCQMLASKTPDEAIAELANVGGVAEVYALLNEVIGVVGGDQYITEWFLQPGNSDAMVKAYLTDIVTGSKKTKLKKEDCEALTRRMRYLEGDVSTYKIVDPSKKRKTVSDT